MGSIQTPRAAYLNKKFLADGRMSEWSYKWTTRLLKRLGFANLAELDECISPLLADILMPRHAGGRAPQHAPIRDGLTGCATPCRNPIRPSGGVEWLILDLLLEHSHRSWGVGEPVDEIGSPIAVAEALEALQVAGLVERKVRSCGSRRPNPERLRGTALLR